MQFQGKLINQASENGKRPNFGPDFGSFSQNLGHNFFFSKIWLSLSLGIMVSYHHVQYQKKSNDPILKKISDGWTDGRE